MEFGCRNPIRTDDLLVMSQSRCRCPILQWGWAVERPRPAHLTVPAARYRACATRVNPIFVERQELNAIATCHRLHSTNGAWLSPRQQL